MKTLSNPKKLGSVFYFIKILINFVITSQDN